MITCTTQNRYKISNKKYRYVSVCVYIIYTLIYTFTRIDTACFILMKMKSDSAARTCPCPWSVRGESFAAMSLRELQVNTLQGDVFTLDVGRIGTVKELKWMLREHFRSDDPIDRQIVRVEVLHLHDTFLRDDAQTLIAAGLHAESEVTVIYKRNEIEAATFPDHVYPQEFFQLNIPQDTTTVSTRAFSSCRKLVKVTIPDSVTSIGDSAFQDCISLESSTIPDSLMQIGESAFRNCSSLKEITIPQSVIEIGCRAFESCTSLESITIPYSVTRIWEGTFESCTSLETITIPDSVIAIWEHAFECCSSLKGIAIPDSVTKIWDSAFRGCTSLERITIPASVTEIRLSTFSGCRSLQSITIPDSVTRIGQRAFAGCSSLKSIAISDSVTEIGSRAFADCSSLKSITIPQSVTKIGREPFAGCSSLESITILNFSTEKFQHVLEGCKANLSTVKECSTEKDSGWTGGCIGCIWRRCWKIHTNVFYDSCKQYIYIYGQRPHQDLPILYIYIYRALV